MSITKNLENRSFLLKSLKNEILGPDPIGSPEIVAPNQLLSWPELQKPRVQPNGQEILWQEKPTKRYGTGVLYPLDSDIQANDEDSNIESIPGKDLDSKETTKLVDDIERISSKGNDQDGSIELDVVLANSYKPSAVGLSVVVDISSNKDLVIQVRSTTRIDRESLGINPCGFYKKQKVIVGESNTPQDLWLRHEVLATDGSVPRCVIESSRLLNEKTFAVPVECNFKNLEIYIVSRPMADKSNNLLRLVTVTLINRNQYSKSNLDELCLFQAGIFLSSGDGENIFAPYPENDLITDVDKKPDSDDSINNLIYRKDRTFAIGHGCSSDWITGRPESVNEVWTDYLPVFETPSVSADLAVKIDDQDFNLQVSMRKLSGIESNDGLEDIALLISAYSDWIEKQINESKSLSGIHLETAKILIDRCKECLRRITEGYDLISSSDSTNAHIKKAFQLANHAMLISQVLSQNNKEREPSFNQLDAISGWSIQYPDLGDLIKNSPRGYWRPFQIAFLLMSLKGIVDDSSPDRETVDLIWFPTGGGKTEAYLGLTAFTLFYKALIGETCSGATVLMRYTLRLLTAQQFERAAILICAMEYLRDSISELIDTKPFSIGLWVGKQSTPNKRDEGRQLLRQLGRNPNAENPFVLLKCPWCGAHFGRTSTGSRRNVVFGYVDTGKTVVYRCPDEQCHFGGDPSKKSNVKNLPISVIDEDLFESPPSLLIGTVDKFALLAWQPKARAFFGIGEDGKRPVSSTSLVIQDELHLISGPLGSMVGAYETVIEDLCTSDGMIKPKIIASTATISRASDQIKALYGRSDSFLFPPSGVESYDSFFSVEKEGPGRLYIGILPTGYGSLQTAQVRCFSSILQNVTLLGDEAEFIDPWWTLLIFYNSIRELGGAATLFLSDIRERLRAILVRKGIPYSKIRKIPNGVEELTSRIRNDEIPKLLSLLQKDLKTIDPKTSRVTPIDVVDVCLASNIIEVGVDVSRLSLMALVGQPKTTSQYIQVSSRVGRDLKKPGMVMMLYGQSKPRDRSHYEKFRTYHQKLYAQVEPTSVTPFSPPSVDRALHGILVSLVRQRGREGYEGASPKYLFDEDHRQLINEITSSVIDRVQCVSPEEAENVRQTILKRFEQWKMWDPIDYGDPKNTSLPEHPTLMHMAGVEIPQNWDEKSWPTMSSMRNVDANCEAEVTDYFLSSGGSD
ncbi:hypothetical protein G6688_05070 [Polynucleobacter paneuropaeus]|nr:hypothetical protein G6688_05070 [Polynucleobacter paneuropaeus]